MDIDGPVEPVWEEELGEDWLHFLSDEQLQVRSQILHGVSEYATRLEIRRARRRGGQDWKPYVAFVKGGAGTGKTAVLLNLALDLAEAGLPVDFRCSRALRAYLSAHTGVNFRTLSGRGGGGTVVFYDDPPSVAQLHNAILTAGHNEDLAVIAAFDPLQWREKYLSSTLRQLDDMAPSFSLRTCYRQSAELLELARTVASTVNERSSWRVAAETVHSERETLRALQEEYLDSLQAVKPGGRSRLRTGAVEAAVKEEAQVLRERWDLWSRLPALLIVEDRVHGVKMHKSWSRHLTGINRKTCDLADTATYKGLDFQAVWMLLDRGYYERIESGQLGLSKVEWEALRDLHIPLTRAKDSTTVFVV